MISVAVETPERPMIIGVTSLPNSTQLMVEIRRKASSYFAQSKATVVDGHFRSDRFSQGGAPLNPGDYQLNVMMPIARTQSPEVRSVIGAEGEKLSGSLVEHGQFGVIVTTKSEFKVGRGADASLDAQARAKAAEDIDKWVIDNCRSLMDLTNALVRSGTLSGKELAGNAQEDRIKRCIADLRANK
jgi:hypothetical protein